MNREQMRRNLRRRLGEATTADQWEDYELNETLNFGLQQVQKDLLKVNPDAVVYIDTLSLVANQEYYALPQGFWYEREVGYLGSDGTYASVEPLQFDLLRGRASSASSVRVSIVGRFIFVSPIPTAALAAGLRLIYVPTLEMSDDTTPPPIPYVLHPAVPIWAKIILTGETGETLDEDLKMLNLIMADLPAHLHHPARFAIEPQLTTDGSYSTLPRGVYVR